MSERIIQLENTDPRELYGSNNRYLNLIKVNFPELKITARGLQLKVNGEEARILYFEEKILEITRHLARYNSLTIKRSVRSNKGIFYLHNVEGHLLYVGASENIKNSLDRLFISDNKLGKTLIAEVHSIKTEAVGNWLVARIKRQLEIREAKPQYQKKRKIKLPYGIYTDKRRSEPTLYLKLREDAGKKKPLLKCENLKSGNRALRMFKRTFKDKDSKLKIISELENLSSSSVATGSGRTKTEKCAFCLEDGELKGYFYYSLNQQISRIDTLKKNMAPVDEPAFTELLKIGLLSGEFKLVNFS